MSPVEISKLEFSLIILRFLNVFFFCDVLFLIYSFQKNRNNDYYDISPRPFGVPSASGAASVNTYTRSKSFKPSSSFSTNNGFVPQRVNVPHQQTQFLQHFNEQTVSVARIYEMSLK